MGLREAWSAIRATWWAPVLGLLLGATSVFGFTLTQPREYVSHTQFFVSTTEAAPTVDAYSSSLFAQGQAASYAELVTGSRTADLVIDALGLDMTSAEFSAKIAASVVPNTVLLDVSVTDSSPERARDIARTIGQEFPDLATQLEPSVNGESPVQLTVVDAAEMPTGPASPQVVRDSALGAAAGLLLGVLVALVRDLLDRTVRNSDEASSAARAPVIGVVLKDSTLEKQHTIDRARASRAVNGYLQLRNNLQHLGGDEPPRVIMVSSAVAAEGRTTVVVNLGLALVRSGHKVAVIEADFHRPRLDQYLEMESGPGLSDVLTGQADLDAVLRRYGDGNLSVLGVGLSRHDNGDLLASSEMTAVVEKLRGANDFVIIDAPPVLPVGEVAGLAAMVDGVVLCIRYGKTRKAQLERASATLRRVDSAILGCVVTAAPEKTELAKAFGYGSG
ncbi:receptor protein-tyrosine kinase [Geodermatophilus bullaregiensis]|uniref:polysaccharide biosynthesis tyrosine autokinase n=1 Tax=Geodermatophilus bullaregiensis TaxID=1564160 RepID=UPI00195EC8F7|nr:polysaccharide biosynthesis tyrosine autokinase [Geodermatophilus bullaregiensis]MBM7807000.1 receptor protein-tyrosine kinase [Geodermatophilus bullaregiensis]